MGIAEIYSEEVHDNLKPLYANWHPGAPIELGDYGEVRGGVFNRYGNIKSLGIHYDVREDPTNDQITFSSKGSTEVMLSAAGAVAAGQPVNVKAALEIKFTSERAVFFNAAQCTYRSIRDLVSLSRDIMGLYKENRWERRWAVVTQTMTAGATTIVVSGGATSGVRLEAAGDVANIDLADASLKLTVATSKNVGLTIAAQQGLTPLIGLSKIQARWVIFGKTLKPMRAAGGHEALDAPLDSRAVQTEESPEELYFGELK